MNSKFFMVPTFFLGRLKKLYSALHFIMANMLKAIGLILIMHQAYACSPGVLVLSAPATIKIDPSQAVGQVIGSATLAFPSTSITADCNDYIPWNSTGTHAFTGEGTPNGKLYPTGIDGVAYRAKYEIPGVPQTQDWFPISWTGPIGGTDMNGGELSVEFVKTGRVATGGVFGPQTIGTWFVAGYPFVEWNLYSSINVVPFSTACTVTQANIAVPLNNVSPAELKNVGDTAKDKDFTIPLNCNAPVSISLAFSGTTTDSANGVFKNTGEDNGSSVGVQILKDGVPVSTEAGASTLIGPVNGNLDATFTARYYALSDKVLPGDVKAVAYATVVYN